MAKQPLVRKNVLGRYDRPTALRRRTVRRPRYDRLPAPLFPDRMPAEEMLMPSDTALSLSEVRDELLSPLVSLVRQQEGTLRDQSQEITRLRGQLDLVEQEKTQEAHAKAHLEERLAVREAFLSLMVSQPVVRSRWWLPFPPLALGLAIGWVIFAPH